jgi:Tubulin binding cofactor C
MGFRNSRYQLLHLMNLVNCNVTCSLRIEGAIHITSCIDTIVTGSCHQLRIHESKNLQCHINSGSGPILEDSSSITFYAAPGDDVIREIKDFNWFRSEPSPNFVVIEEEVTMAQEEKKESRVQNSTSPQSEELELTSCDDTEDDEL